MAVQFPAKPQSLRAQPLPRKGELFEVAIQFLIAFDTLATGLTACALSVKAYGFASSPKGRAKSSAGSFLIMPNTLATSLTAWLSLRGKTSPAPGEDVTIGDKRGNLARERLRGLLTRPQTLHFSWKHHRYAKGSISEGAVTA